MAIYQGDTKISGNAKVVALPMFFATYQPRKLNNASWLRAEPYSWHSADVYVSAYAHLADNISGVTAETETIAGTTITFYRLSDEIKVVLPDQISNLDAIYNATGIGYYFVLDTTNKRFKLPRNIYGFTGYRGDAGGYVAESLPNITGTSASVGISGDPSEARYTGAFRLISAQSSAAKTVASLNTNSYSAAAEFNSSLVSPAYQDNAPVQQRAVQAYLYFYVGNTVQNETSVAVAQLTEAVNGKADTDLGNLTAAGKVIAAKASMPSTSYTDLALGASGADYTAPADGWFAFAKISTAQTQTSTARVYSGSTLLYRVNSEYHNAWVVPVQAGYRLNLAYTLGGATQLFRFIYAEGAK